MASTIQAVLFEKSKWKTTEECRKELKKMGFTPLKKVDITDTYYRYRIKHPSKTKKHFIKTLSERKGIKAVIEV